MRVAPKAAWLGWNRLSMNDLDQLTSAILSLIGMDFDLGLAPDEWPEELQPTVRALATLGATLERRVVSADHVAALFRATPIPLVQLSPALMLTATNPAARLLFGPSVEGLSLPAVLGDLMVDPDHPVPSVLDLLGGTRCDLLDARGDVRVNELRLAPLHGPYGLLQGYVLSAHDVTADVEARARAEEGRRNALESAEKRTRFLAMVSHELRTPLNGIIGMAGFLNHANPILRAQAVEVTRSCADQLSGLISEYLDFSQLAADSVPLVRERVELEAVMRHCAELSRLRLKTGVDWRQDTSDLAVPVVMGDPTRLRQLIDNLLDNATRYTDSGWVSVQLSSVRTGEGVACTIVVEDSGRGIEEGELPELFEPYRRWQPRGGSHGLGLAIVQQLVTRMNGSIEVQSTVGQGSRFELRLTLEEAPAEAVQEPAVAPRHCRVLCVDDNAVNRMVVRVHLEELGCVVEEAVDGVDCVERMSAAAEPFDLVLMDCEMPRMDGMDASRALARLGFSVPVVALTAHALPSQRDLCARAGMVGFLTKPVRREQLQTTLSRLDELSLEQG